MASVPYEFECDKSEAVLPDPNANKRVGYITCLKGFSATAPITFANDITCYSPYNATTLNYGFPNGSAPTGQVDGKLGKMKVVGVMEKFSWDGAVGGAVQLEFWCSQENAVQIKTAQQSTLTSTKIEQCGWWIANYDQELKVWYEQCYPIAASDGSMKGMINGLVGPQDNPELNVDLNGAPAKDGIDVMLYKVTVHVAPGANQQYDFFMANSPKKNQVKNWGLIVGSLAKAQYKG